MLRLVRDNAADHRVTRDVEMLGKAYDAEAVAQAAVNAEEARAADLAALTEAYADTSPGADSWWRPAAVHVNRYRTLYAVAAVVLAVLLFRNPVPLSVDELAEDATELPPSRSRVATDTNVVPEFAAPELATPLDSGGTEEALPFEAPAPEPAPSGAATSAPAGLHIASSGYASVFSGTPVEQPPPGNGLPVESLASSETKYSFMRLTGKGRVLRLRMLTDEGASLNDAAAAVQACHITTGNWTPARGVAKDQAPAYDAANCVQGSRAQDGTWSFSFVLDDPADRNGWAIVPITAQGTFRVTFAPAAV